MGILEESRENHRQGHELLGGRHGGLRELKILGGSESLKEFIQPINKALVDEVGRLIPMLGFHSVFNRALYKVQ